jgi:hypothetical protein
MRWTACRFSLPSVCQIAWSLAFITVLKFQKSLKLVLLYVSRGSKVIEMEDIGRFASEEMKKRGPNGSG